MKRLYILRHAEAAPGQRDDKARKLTPYGRAQAQKVARMLAGGAGLPPVSALHSPAARVRETVAAVRAALPDLSLLEIDEMYNASAETLFNVIRLHGGESATLLLAGHNPGVGVLAGMLCGSGEPEAFQSMLNGFSPAALATIECPVERWGDLMPDMNRIVGFERF